MEELITRLQEYITKKKKPTVEAIMKELSIQEYEVYGLVDFMKRRGACIDIIDGRLTKIMPIKENNEIKIPVKNSELKFIAISDIHYGSKWDNPNLVDYAYELAEKDNCQFVTNSGDVFEGDFHGKRPDHIYQVKALGMEQLDYVVDKYPHSSLPTYFISGNHCATFIKTCGADIGKMLADKRPDLTYLGMDLGDIRIGKTLLRLRHGTGGNAYAKGYKLQKYCETLTTSDLPDIILQGHFHYSAYFKNRDIHCFNVPSLQSYTPYAKSLGMAQEMGFWEITCELDSKGNIVSIKPELYQFEEKLTRKRVK
jgi:predicted phosphodiesterase